MPDSVFVTGVGIISAIGSDVESVWNSLREGRTGIGPMKLIDSAYKGELPVAEIHASNKELLGTALPRVKNYYSRTALLGMIAARQAIAQSGAEAGSLENAGLISATTVGGMDRTEIFYKGFMSDKSSGRIREAAGHDCGDSTEKIADNLGIGGYLSTINTACSSSANAIMLGARMIRQGKLKMAITGGVDCLTKFTINGFNSLMILDKEQCRPFDENRNGLNLGEGAAYLVLESEEEVRRTGKKVLCEISGYGNACDAYHQTASSPEGHGALLSMKQALETAGLAPSDISYINTHGTGTKNNDLSEGVAIERLFQDAVPPCSSTKSFTGHTLGAAGALEAVLSVLALRHNCIYQNLNFSVQMHELHFTPVTGFQMVQGLNHIMSNSFGFGGNNSSLIFSKH
ncbi:MAG: beta-ketoacyl-[acyl-carrier-protein] synthase family protein [Bacteroidales bacterium]